MKMSNYVRKDLVPGYTGKFVIHLHDASHLHFDLRLSFPVDSISDALGTYCDKRPSKGVEPITGIKDEPGLVLRSWAIPKHRLPSHKPLLAKETENHVYSYLGFKGIIPSGYGAGTVKIFDHGDYVMDEVKFDKKYVFTMNGQKAKGQYALIKTAPKNFLWIKTKKSKKICVSYFIKNIAYNL
jgi:hypothetical protein